MVIKVKNARKQIIKLHQLVSSLHFIVCIHQAWQEHEADDT